jgi:hypothetical protein
MSAPSVGWWSLVGVAAVSVLAQLGIYDRGLVALDEGQLMNIAVRINHGEVLYRDIYTGIFPGVYYITALLLALGGNDLLVTRAAQVLVNAATAACLWWLTRRVTSRGWALVPVVLYLVLVVLSFPVLTMLNYSPVSLLFGLAALVCLLRYLEHAGTAAGIAVGVLLAGCALTKQNFGGLALAAVLLTCLWPGQGAFPGRSRVGGLLPIGLGGAATTAAVALYFATAGAFGSLIAATVTTIGDSQLTAFNDPFPPVFGPHPLQDGRFVFVYTPPTLFNYLMRGETLLGLAPSPLLRSTAIRLAYGGTLATLALGGALLIGSRRLSTVAARATRGVVVFAVALFFGIFPSAIWSHLAFIAAPVLPVLAIAIDRGDRVLARWHPLAAWGWRGLWTAALVLAVVVAVAISHDVRRWHPEPAGIPGASIYVAPDVAATYGRALAFIEGCAGPDEPIFVAPDMPLLYVASGRRNPTPFDLTIPGNVDGPAIVAALEATGTRCVVYGPEMYAQFQSFKEIFPTLVAYLEREYERTEVIRDGTRPWYGLVRTAGAGCDEALDR